MTLPRFVPPLVLLLAAACSPNKPEAPEPAASAAATPVATIMASAAGAEAATTTSRYSSLKDCKTTELNEEEDWSVSRCPGLGGYSLVLNYGDARDDLALRRAGRKDAGLSLPILAGGGFNTLGETIEWRGSGEGGAFNPVALIVRNSAVQDPERPENPTALLVVVDLAQGCAVAQVKPGPGQNERARVVADGPKLPCLKVGS